MVEGIAASVSPIGNRRDTKGVTLGGGAIGGGRIGVATGTGADTATGAGGGGTTTDDNVIRGGATVVGATVVGAIGGGVIGGGTNDDDRMGESADAKGAAGIASNGRGGSANVPIIGAEVSLGVDSSRSRVDSSLVVCSRVVCSLVLVDRRTDGGRGGGITGDKLLVRVLVFAEEVATVTTGAAGARAVVPDHGNDGAGGGE